MSAQTEAPRGRLAGRLTALALAQLALIVGVGIVIAYLTRPAAPRDLSTLVHDVARDLEHRPDAVSAEALLSLGEAHGLALSLYGPDRALLVSMVDPPVHLHRHGPPPGSGPPDRPPGPPDGRGLFPGSFDHGPFDGGPFAGGPPGRPPELSVELADGRWLAARPERPAPEYLGPLLTLLAGILVLGIGGLLTARWIVSPLHTLRDAARSIASGDLRARVGLSRRDEFGDVARAFDEMADRIEASRRAERELLANVSHELRTPLARLRVALELASEGHESGKAALADAAVDLGELEAIIDSILAAVRMERVPGRPGEAFEYGLPASSLRDVAIDELLEGAAARFRSRHASRPVELTVLDPLPGVLVDPLLVRRVLDNLLENAHKYSPEPLSKIALTARHSQEDGEFFVEITVADEGMGIDAEDLPRVFEPFFRAERSRTRKAGGVGLGLTLCKRIVEAHGGTITLTSEPRRGTTARVRLPARPPSTRTDTKGHDAANTG